MKIFVNLKKQYRGYVKGLLPGKLVATIFSLKIKFKEKSLGFSCTKNTAQVLDFETDT